MDKINIPDSVLNIIYTLERNKHSAFLVGGCVRDHLLGVTPTDFDITTSACPWEVKEIFSDCQVIPTGEKHGTVTVISSGTPFEITTFRLESGYSDGRHPDKIEFSCSIEDDLARRDLTVNAIAYSPTAGFVDPYDGIEDIKHRIIRAVGDPKRRFAEDSLRVLRALRFSSTLSFEIESETEKELFTLKDGLKRISAEKIYTELKKLLCGRDAGKIIQKYPEIIGTVIPELLPMIGFDQKNRYHKYDLLEHTVRVVDGVPPLPHLRFAALLHDVEKPSTFTLDSVGGHFYGHEKKSGETAKAIMERLKADKDTRDKVVCLVLNHGLVLQKDNKFIKRCLNRYGKDTFRDIILLSLSDNSALSDLCSDRPEKIREISLLTENIISLEPCLTIKDLKIDGNDLISLGLTPGKDIGTVLNEILSAVIDGDTENEKDLLIKKAEEIIRIKIQKSR
ncbi:MAG: tRNA nucleotidyltransferase [Clostridia bacterium]|nr:tRNA nucleotidyltransferase [Clostridia bacterium]